MITLEINQGKSRSKNDLRQITHEPRVSVSKLSGLALRTAFNGPDVYGARGTARHQLLQAMVAFWKIYYADKKQDYWSMYPSTSIKQKASNRDRFNLAVNKPVLGRTTFNSLSYAETIPSVVDYAEETTEIESQIKPHLFDISQLQLTIDCEKLVQECKPLAATITRDENINRGHVAMELKLLIPADSFCLSNQFDWIAILGNKLSTGDIKSSLYGELANFYLYMLLVNSVAASFGWDKHPDIHIEGASVYVSRINLEDVLPLIRPGNYEGIAVTSLQNTTGNFSEMYLSQDQINYFQERLEYALDQITTRSANRKKNRNS